MTFFPDLAPYRYGFAPVAWDQNGPPSLEPIELYTWMWDPEDGAFDLPELAVGWLDPPHEYPRGQLTTPLVEKLDRLCRTSRYHVTRGFHPCGICGDASDGLGSKEIRLLGDGVVYAAPDKIVHYVSAHAYAPPRGFVEALERCDGLARPRRGAPRPVTIDMIPHEHVDVSLLDGEVRASLRRDHREQIFQDLVLQDRGDVVAVLTRIDLPGSSEPVARSWDVPKRALLNIFQAVHSIISMLEASHTEGALAVISQRQHARGSKP
jgi:hypothetical protein